MSQKVIMAGNILEKSRPWLIHQTLDICAERVGRDYSHGWGEVGSRRPGFPRKIIVIYHTEEENREKTMESEKDLF